jgi:hypothetical protein
MDTFLENEGDENLIKSVLKGNKIRGCVITYRDFLGRLHRKNGPAVQKENGKCIWFFKGMMHREDGPAEYNKIHDFSNSEEYYLNDKNFTKEEWEKEVTKIKLKRILNL